MLFWIFRIDEVIARSITTDQLMFLSKLYGCTKRIESAEFIVDHMQSLTVFRCTRFDNPNLGTKSAESVVFYCLFLTTNSNEFQQNMGIKLWCLPSWSTTDFHRCQTISSSHYILLPNIMRALRFGLNPTYDKDRNLLIVPSKFHTRLLASCRYFNLPYFQTT